MIKEKNYDVIVAGAGTMGSAACFELARRGLKTLGLEKFSSPHENGSHGGESRLIRKAYFENAAYIPLLLEAYKKWAEIEQLSGVKLFHQTGILYFGPPGSKTINNMLGGAKTFNIPVKEYDVTESVAKYPQFSMPSGHQCCFEPEAGFVTPGRAINTFLEQAMMHGADLHLNEPVLTWEKKSGVLHVTTAKETYRTKKLVLAAGAWSRELMKNALPFKLKVTEQLLVWFRPKKWEDFALDRFPCWVVAEEGTDEIYYGMPHLPAGQLNGPLGLKVGYHLPGKEIRPEDKGKFNARPEISRICDYLKDKIPGLINEPLEARSCLYTYSPDEDFVIDVHPLDPQVVFAAGFSGHGFKFMPLVGAILADLATVGKTTYPADFLKLSRFKT